MRCAEVSTVATVALVLLTACGTDTVATSGPIPTSNGSPRPLALPSRAQNSIPVPMAAGTALAADGWSHVPPDHVQAKAMAIWLQKYVDSIAALLATILHNTNAMNSAADKGDIRGATAACDDISQQLSARITLAMPAPDPDMSTALKSVLNAGRALTAKCAAINDAPRAVAVEGVHQCAERLGSTLTVLGNVVQRDATVVASAGAKAKR